jgi:hypothetical protein
MAGFHLQSGLWQETPADGPLHFRRKSGILGLKAGLAERNVDPKTLRKRQMVYYPVAGVLAVVTLLGIYGFVNGEKTSITTIPPVSNLGPIYVPQTPTPFPTPQPTPTSGKLVLTWNGYIGPLFQNTCGACHGINSFTGLSMDTYANIMIGGKDGPVIIPGDANNSKLVQVQSAGGHPGQLSANDLIQVKEWINTGAPEK